MKRLFLIRHAKSSWKDASLSDFDRPLNKRGKHDAPMMATKFREENFSIDLMISSLAKRAAQTARFFRHELESVQLKFEPEIYEASATTLMKIVNSQDSNIDNLILFGHNPGFTFFAENLCAESFGNIPTCGIVGIEFSVNAWDHVSMNSGTLIHYDYPKKYY